MLSPLFAFPIFIAQLRLVILAASISIAWTVASLDAQPSDARFIDHGVAAPVSSHRGAVATIDGDGRDVLVLWLMDHRGGYAILVIDAETGRSEQIPLPFPLISDAPYASLLSSSNKFYSVFGNHFVEFDVAKRTFTFSHLATPNFAMGMTEDDAGVIWAVVYPQSAVVSFDPKTREFHDYGNVYPQNWSQYQRHIAADDTGWIYFGLGMTASQIVAFNPKTGKATPLLEESERKKGTAYVYRDIDGKVYAQALGAPGEPWYELYKGARRSIGPEHASHPKPIVTGNQGLFANRFTDGKRVTTCDLIERQLVIEDQMGNSTTVPFAYTSEGAGVMGVAAAPDGTIGGGTMFPFRSFFFDPRTNTWTRRQAWYQWNTLAVQAGHLLVGGYPGGFLLEWDPRRPWVKTEKNRPDTNPTYLTDCTPVLHRPARLLAHPDGHTVVMGGGPDYGYTGGGLLLWDREKHTRELMTDKQIIPDQSTLSLVALPDGKILGGTTVQPGSGGEKKAAEAELYILDLVSKKIIWHCAVLPGVQQYVDLRIAPSGLVYGVADRKTFFVFDPVKKTLVSQRDTVAEFGPSAAEQGPRVFVTAPNGTVYALFKKGVVHINLETFELKLVAETPVGIEAGGDFLEGRVYFANGSHVYSVRVEH
jgi:hypothetical protein